MAAKKKLNFEGSMARLEEIVSLLEKGDAPLEQAMIQQMLSVLSDMKGEVRIDMESMECYLSLPMAFTGKEEDTWYSLDLGAYEAQLLSGMSMAQLNQLEEELHFEVEKEPIPAPSRPIREGDLVELGGTRKQAVVTAVSGERARRRASESRARGRVMRGVGSESRVMAITSPRSARTRPRPPP